MCNPKYLCFSLKENLRAWRKKSFHTNQYHIVTDETRSQLFTYTELFKCTIRAIGVLSSFESRTALLCGPFSNLYRLLQGYWDPPRYPRQMQRQTIIKRRRVNKLNFLFYYYSFRIFHTNLSGQVLIQKI